MTRGPSGPRAAFLALVLAAILLAVPALAGGEAVTPVMSMLDAIVLGLVEGITEYLPVSSTGHLLLVERLLGIPGSHAAHAFAITIQAGAIAAVLVLYRRRLWSMVRGLGGRDPAGRRLLSAVVAACLPAAVVGFLFHEWIEENLFGLVPVTVAWFVGGVAILALGKRRGGPRPGLPLEQVTWRMGLWVGLAQTIALWPGVSRSLVTIVGGMLVGLGLSAAVELSFLVGLVILSGATAYKAVDAGGAMLEAYGPATLTVGFLTAALSAAIAVRWLVRWLSHHGLQVFGWYRVILAVVVALLLLAGRL